MTTGQERALRELQRLSARDPASFGVVEQPTIRQGRLFATVSLRVGAIETRQGGLDLREREEFILGVPPDFPFDRPSLRVGHNRFAGFPHVTWVTSICLYQSSIEWNPSDGLYGFFDRLRLWLARAAINDMDPLEGPLEPPHHDTDFSQKPVVIRADAPCRAGEAWNGVALLQEHANRVELTGWNDLDGEWPTGGRLALAVMLSEALPMEFPSSGADLFSVFERAGLPRERIIRRLALSALLTPDTDAAYFVFGLPMRRAVDGSLRTHLAVWAVDAEKAASLRQALPQVTDTDEIITLREALFDTLVRLFELSAVKWCQIFEDRPEIVQRRDAGTAVAWFAGKKILILGCGALGSLIAEMVARAQANAIDLVDNALVKPGLLARQNFELIDIATNKADGLAHRLRAIAHGCTITPHPSEAFAFVKADADRLRSYDIVLDCTASAIFQMKLERHWETLGARTPAVASVVIDGQARHCLCVIVPPNASGGIWDSYVALKELLCRGQAHQDLVETFYSERAATRLFQPEPGCSDPTFAASTADVAGLAASALNLTAESIAAGHNVCVGAALSAIWRGRADGAVCTLLTQFGNVQAGPYTLRIAPAVVAKARAYVRQNSRLRSPAHETGGLLWGLWDDAVQKIWIFDASGPPPDSRHDPAHFVCGVEGTRDEHTRRVATSYGVCGFVGHWHTHPELPPHQSSIDIATMTTLVSTIGQNQKRSVMLIFGRAGDAGAAGVYVYESLSTGASQELISVGLSHIALEMPVA
jgi:hypothetical protein